MWYILGVSVLLLASCLRIVKPNQVVLKNYFGYIRHRVFRSGIRFLPRFPGIHLIRIPTRMIPFRFEGTEEHKVWTKDHQLLLVQVTGNLRFPYIEPESLILMVMNEVPLSSEADLQKWIEDEVISGLRDIMAGYTLEQAIARSNLGAINTDAQRFFLRSNGLFAKSGICGNDLTSFTQGTGEVILRVEQINPTAPVQKALEAPVVARYNADAARETARMNAEEVGGQILGIVARQHAISIEGLEADLRAHPDKRGKSVKDGGYAETFDWAQAQTTRDRAGAAGELSYDESHFDIASGGQPIDPNFAVLFAGVREWNKARSGGRGGRSGKGDRGGGGGKKWEDMTDAEKKEDFDRRRKAGR